MGISLRTLLNEYFYKEEIQDALEEIGLNVSGTKNQLAGRLAIGWAPHNRSTPELLDFLNKGTLSQFAKDYGLNPLGGRSALVERITKASLIKVPPEVPSSMPVFGGRFWLSVPFILSLILTILVYFFLPSIGLSEVGVQVAAIIPFFLGVWRGLVFLDHLRQN